MIKRKIRVNDVQYDSIADAARAMRVDPLVLRNWLLSKNPKWAHIQYVDQVSASTITRSKGVQVCYRGELFSSLKAAARKHGLTPPSISHILNSPLHPDSYYLTVDGRKLKHPDKCQATLSYQKQRRAAARTTQPATHINV